MTPAREHNFFIIGMWWRIGYGVVRIAFGLTLLHFVGASLTDILGSLMSHELTEDPHDVLYGLFTNFMHGHAYAISYFLAFYFIFWGLLDVVLSYNLIRHRLWAFPASFVLIGLFILYEVFRFSHTHSLILLGVICVDTIILALIWREYTKVQNHLPT